MSSSCRFQNLGKSMVKNALRVGSIAQGLEHWSCKPGVASSNLAGAYVCFFFFSPPLFFWRGEDALAKTFRHSERLDLN